MAASLPTHYYTRSRHVLKNQSRLRIPYTITSTHAGIDNEKTTLEAEDERDVTTIPTTTAAATATAPDTTTLSSQQPDVYAVNPEIFKNHYKTKFNLTYITKPPTNTSPQPQQPKRINYSYHPIIDFFEYNGRLTATTSTTPRPTPSARTSSSTIAGTHFLSSSSTQLYPHKIPKSQATKSRIHFQQKQKQYQSRQKQQQQTERRIGYGADVAATAVAAGDGSSDGVVSNTFHLNTHTNTHSNTDTYTVDRQYSTPVTNNYESTVQTDVWHPVVIQDF